MDHQVSKPSFSEEKEAKRLCPFGAWPQRFARVLIEENSLVLSFKKEHPSLAARQERDRRFMTAPRRPRQAGNHAERHCRARALSL